MSRLDTSLSTHIAGISCRLVRQPPSLRPARYAPAKEKLTPVRDVTLQYGVRLVFSRIVASGLPPRTLHVAGKAVAGVRQGRPQARRYYLSCQDVPLKKTLRMYRRAKFYNGNQVGWRRPVSVFPLRDIPLGFAKNGLRPTRKRKNSLSKPPHLSSTRRRGGGFVEASLQAEVHNYKTPLRGASLVFA